MILRAGPLAARVPEVGHQPQSASSLLAHPGSALIQSGDQPDGYDRNQCFAPLRSEIPERSVLHKRTSLRWPDDFGWSPDGELVCGPVLLLRRPSPRALHGEGWSAG